MSKKKNKNFAKVLNRMYGFCKKQPSIYPVMYATYLDAIMWYVSYFYYFIFDTQLHVGKAPIHIFTVITKNIFVKFELFDVYLKIGWTLTLCAFFMR